MHLAIPFTLLLVSYVAASPTIHHAQIKVEITDTDVQKNQVDALHSSEEPVMNQVGSGVKSLPYNFTLNARSLDGSRSLPFGFPSSGGDGFIRGELGISTEFAFRGGRLITGDRALGYHLARNYPPWTSLWSLDWEDRASFIELIAVPQDVGGRLVHFLVFEGNQRVFGTFEIESGKPIFIAPQGSSGNQLQLAVEPIRDYSDNIDADSAEQLL